MPLDKTVYGKSHKQYVDGWHVRSYRRESVVMRGGVKVREFNAATHEDHVAVANDYLRECILCEEMTHRFLYGPAIGIDEP